MNVLSLFDGCAGALQALRDSGIRVKNYYSFEINEAAMAVAESNHNCIDFMGDVLNVKKHKYENIDLLIGGPECTTYSVAGKMDAKGFWQIELFKWCIDNLRPRYWLMENVKSKNEIVKRIDECIGVKNKLINSRHFSMQSRERRYWSNFDISEDFGDGPLLQELSPGEIPICFSSSGRGLNPVERRISDNSKAHTLTKTGYSNRSFSGFITNKREIRNFTRHELEQLQGFPVGYTDYVSETEARKILGNSFNIPTIVHILKGLKDAP